VAATPVVEHLDVVEQIGNGLGATRVARAMHPFVLQAVEEALRGRVVPAISLTAACGCETSCALSGFFSL
jgi:hypothetical protein